MKEVHALLRAVAPKQVTVMLIGESGSGKEVLARCAHELSDRSSGPFVPINCAAIPEALFESELFGHERGAFTGATQRAIGKIEAAEGGTLFLDEIGEMPISMQAKLLRFLENRRYMRVGGSKKLEANVRLLVATLRPLEQDIAAGRFRGDLFYRIQGIALNVPPLRERRADILPLLNLFLAQLSARHGVRRPRLTRRAKALLLEHAWPGNVRELKNLVEVLCLLRGGRQVRPADLPRSLTSSTPASIPARSDSALLTVDVNSGLEAAIRSVVERALHLDAGDSARAAARLHISVRTVQRYVASGRVAAPSSSTNTAPARSRRTPRTNPRTGSREP
jgi:DNA-binding NtrC family response regulator